MNHPIPERITQTEAFQTLQTFSPMLRGEERQSSRDRKIVDLFNEQFDYRLWRNKAVKLGSFATKTFADGSKLDLTLDRNYRESNSDSTSVGYIGRGISLYLGQVEQPIDELLLDIRYSNSAWFGDSVQETCVLGLQADFDRYVSEHANRETFLDLTYDGYRRLLPAFAIHTPLWSNNFQFNEADIVNLFDFAEASIVTQVA